MKHTTLLLFLCLIIGYKAQSQNRLFKEWESVKPNYITWTANRDEGIPPKYNFNIVSDNIYTICAGYSQSEANKIRTIKKDLSGNTIWEKEYEDIGFNITPHSIAENINSLYILGNSTDQFGLGEIILLKYDKNGQLIWDIKYNDQARSLSPIKVINSNSGNTYVLANRQTTDQNNSIKDFILIKYNSSGLKLWEKNYDIPSKNVRSFDMALDKNENIFITGAEFFPATISGLSGNILTIKINPNGVVKWSGRINSGIFATDNSGAGKSIKIDDSGNIYVVGSISSTGNFADLDIATIKYTTNGVLSWIRKYNSPSNNSDTGIDIFIKNGNIYTLGNIGTEGFIVFKNKLDGTLIWTYNSAATKLANTLTADNKDRITITAGSISSNSTPQMNVISIKKDGTLESEQIYNNSVSDEIDLDLNDNIYITGTYIDLSNQVLGLLNIKYNLSNPFGGGNNTGISSGNGMIIFQSKELFNFVLDSIGNINDNSRFISKLENKFNYKSLLLTLEEKEDLALDAGVEIDSTNDPENHFVVDEDLRAVLNDKAEMQIGSSIFKFISSDTIIEILNADPLILAKIRNNDLSYLTSPNIRIQTQNAANVSAINKPKCLDFTWEIPQPSSPLHLNFNLESNTDYSATSNPTVTWFYYTKAGIKVSIPNSNSYPISFNFDTAGIYKVYMVIVDGFCKNDTTTHYVNVGDALSCNPIIVVRDVKGNDFTFNNFSYGLYTGIEVDFGDGIITAYSASTINIIHSYADTGFYKVSIKLFGGAECDTLKYTTQIRVYQYNTDPDCGCDRKDLSKQKYIKYANNSKRIKAKAWHTSWGIIGCHRIGVKIKTYKKGTIKWKKSNVTKLEAGYDGFVWANDKEYTNTSSTALKTIHCINKVYIPITNEIAPNSKKIKFSKRLTYFNPLAKFGFGVGQRQLNYTFKVENNGTDILILFQTVENKKDCD